MSYYPGIWNDQMVLCEVITSYQPAVYNFSGLISKNGYYFPAQMDSNSNRIYYLNLNGWVHELSSDGTDVPWNTYTVDHSVPSDYYTVIQSQDFDLEGY